MRRGLAAAVAAVMAAAWACGGSSVGDPPPVTDGDTQKPDNRTPDAGQPDAGEPDAGTPDSGTPDSGTPDSGTPDSGTPDAGNPPTDGGTPEPGPGPWPEDARLNYTQRYNLGRVKSMSVDEAHNIWLLNGESIGVLRPGDTAPRWVSNIGQASEGFGDDKRANDSTVICGGAAGQAYVGYRTYDLKDDPEFEGLHPNYIVGPGECYVYDTSKPCAPFSQRRWDEFQKGDVDVVSLDASGNINPEVVHLGNSTGFGYKNIGIRNSNNWHYDEDRSVLSCRTVRRGKFKGEVYLGSNHGVTRVRGLDYNAHRHPVWDVDGSLRIGYNYGLGIARNGDLLIANEWKIGALTPPDSLDDFDDTEKVPFILNTYVDAMNDLPTQDKWRAFEQTADGRYYLGSAVYGVWQMTVKVQPDGKWRPTYEKVSGPGELENINSMAATDDGSLFIGTNSGGLWRLDAKKQLTRVEGIDGNQVKEVLYDPSVSPAMLFVLTDKSLTVLRGH